jgi:hypothetical protein
MSAVWTCHLRCFDCGKEFILNRVSLDEVFAAEVFFPCPHCLSSASFDHPHRLSYLYVSNLPYRKARNGDAWHYSEYCSGWPMEDFIELDFPPVDEICNECKVIVGS